MSELIEILVFGKRPMWDVADILRERMELHRKWYRRITAETTPDGIRIEGIRKRI